MNSAVSEATQSSGKDGMLAQLLQKDQLATTYYLYKGCECSLRPEKDWNRIQKYVYPEFCLIAATFNALKDILLYPIQGFVRACSVIISLDINDVTQGFKEITLSPLQTLALSVYLLSLSLGALFNHKGIYAPIEDIVKDRMTLHLPHVTPKKANEVTDPGQIPMNDIVHLKFEDWIKFTQEMLQKSHQQATEITEMIVEALRIKDEINNVVAKTSRKEPPAPYSNLSETNSHKPSDHFNNTPAPQNIEKEMEKIEKRKKKFKGHKKKLKTFTQEKFQEAKKKNELEQNELEQQKLEKDVLINLHKAAEDGESVTWEKYKKLKKDHVATEPDGSEPPSEVFNEVEWTGENGSDEIVSDEEDSSEKTSESKDSHKKVRIQEESIEQSKKQVSGRVVDPLEQQRKAARGGYCTPRHGEFEAAKESQSQRLIAQEGKSKTKGKEKLPTNNKQAKKGPPPPPPPTPPNEQKHYNSLAKDQSKGK